ncbi:FAD-dependent oxidoreductase [Nannocystis pusilla]|uniref:FAD-dependent oxidoreductase n=1 Tax=Nannocystis pusilla TaxID=889268 RepID=UPI003DA4F3A9
MENNPSEGQFPASSQVVVVGAGMAGLTAAVRLAEAGARVVVVEAGEVAGGRLATLDSVEVRWRGTTMQFPIEHGLHGVWRQYRNLRRLLADHGLERGLVDAGTQELIVDSPAGVATVDIGASVRGSRLPAPLAQFRPWFSAPFARHTLKAGPVAFARMIGCLSHALAFDLASPDDLAAYDRASVEALIADWPPSFRQLFETFSHSIYFEETRSISLAALFTGIQLYLVNDRRDSHFNVFAADSEQCVIAPLVAAIRRRGGQVLLGTRATGLQIAGGRATGVTLETARGAETLPAGAVVVALDPSGQERFLAGTPLAAAEDGAAPAGLPSVVVRLWLAGAPRPERAPSGLLVDSLARNFFWLHRLQEPFGSWHARTGGGVLEAHLYGDLAVRVQDVEDSAVAQRIAAMVRRLWPEVPDELVHAHVQRNPPTQVALRVGQMARLPGVTTALANVARCGDGIACGSPAMFLERACLTGVLAARAVAPSLGLAASRIAAPLGPLPPERTVAVARAACRIVRGLLPLKLDRGGAGVADEERLAAAGRRR